jgi:hypothetical protein
MVSSVKKFIPLLFLAACGFDQTPHAVSGDILWKAAQEWNAVCPGVFVRDDVNGSKLRVETGACPIGAMACTYQGDRWPIMVDPRVFKEPIKVQQGLFVHELGHNLYLYHRDNGNGVMAVPQNAFTPTPEDVRALIAVGWNCPSQADASVPD